MALEVRRIVTGHDSQGNAVVATDERLSGTGAAEDHRPSAIPVARMCAGGLRHQAR